MTGRSMGAPAGPLLRIPRLTRVIKRETHAMGWASMSVILGPALLAACGVNAPEGSAAFECTPQIRMNGQVYSGEGYTDHGATKFGRADEADCHDLGRDPAGSVFPDSPRQVDVWTFAEYSSKQVVGVRFDADTFSLFISQSVPQDEAERIERELRTD
jgi:hypothetical protein